MVCLVMWSFFHKFYLNTLTPDIIKKFAYWMVIYKVSISSVIIIVKYHLYFVMIAFRAGQYIYQLTIKILSVGKVSKYGVISGPYFSLFGLNTEIYRVNLSIQSEYRKIRARNNSVFGHFTQWIHSVGKKSIQSQENSVINIDFEHVFTSWVRMINEICSMLTIKISMRHLVNRYNLTICDNFEQISHVGLISLGKCIFQVIFR